MVAASNGDLDPVVGFYTVLQKNIEARVSYGQFLTESYLLLEDGNFPGVDNGDAEGVRSLKRTIHLSLCTEFYKTGELLTALCRSSDSPARSIPDEIIDVRGHQVDDFLDGISDLAFPGAFRDMFPFPDPTSLGLRGEEEAAAERVVTAACEMLKEALEFYRAQREFLKPFRHKFSHSYGVVTGGNATQGPGNADPGLVIPVLEGSPGSDDGDFVATKVLFSNRDRTQKVLTMQQTLMQLEIDILKHRVMALANNGTPVLPTAASFLPGTEFNEEINEAYDQALASIGYSIPSVNVTMEASPDATHLDDALEFYNRRLA